LFERPVSERSSGRAILVHINFTNVKDTEDLDEFQELVISAGAIPLVIVTSTRQAPDSKYFIGSGKAKEIQGHVLSEESDIVLFNHSLSPAQERNLERLVQCRVLDRTGLILDIFAQRARSFEGKLQVELAQLQHLSTRLVRGWSHLERQKGGIGLRGPGETQLETDRRLIRNRIKSINKRLKKYQSQRDQSRKARRRALLPTISLVGYTNVGKSSIFKALTGADVYIADQLFATLDPMLRKANLPGYSSVILADTVGFIRHLPHDLVAAFQATLQETKDSNLLLHVIDASDTIKRAHIKEVENVLEEIEAQDVPVVQVFNKIDLLEDCEPRIDRNQEGKSIRVWVSVETGEGIELLQTAIAEHLFGDPVYRSLCLKPEQGKLRAKLFELNAVLSERVDEEGNYWISIRLAKSDFENMFPDLQSDE